MRARVPLKASAHGWVVEFSVSGQGDLITRAPVGRVALGRPDANVVTAVTPSCLDMRVEVGTWVLLAYRLPREPSAPRLAVWRRLRRLGVAQLLDGLVALPLDSRNREHLEWVAEEVAEHGGEASIWVARPGTTREERELAGAMRDRIAGEYGAVIAEAEAAAAEGIGRHRRTLARLRRELERIGRRDYFPPPERDRAHEAVEALAEALEVEVGA
jgi:hypothetical protein